MPDTLVLLNPAAGRGRAGTLWPELERELRAAGVEFDLARTASPAEAITLAERLTPALPYLKAEIAFAVQHEMALTLNDVLLRRMHLIHEDAQQGLAHAPLVAASLAGLLGWTREETARQVQAYQHQVALTRRYRSE